MIIANRKQLLNGNAFVLGVSGGGKSFFAKSDITNLRLATNADIIIIDPEREYGALVRALGGEVINLSATSDKRLSILIRITPSAATAAQAAQVAIIRATRQR